MQDFKREIKLFLIVAVVSTVLALGGIWLLKAMQPASPAGGPAPIAQTPPPPAPRDQAELDFAGWQTYRNDEFGFEFEYPKVFAEDPQCRVEEVEDGIRVGSRIDIVVREAGTLTLSEYVGSSFDTEGLFEINKTPTKVDGKEAIAISYRVEGIGRVGTITYVLSEGKAYTFSFLAGGECPAAYEHDILEISVLSQILSTFRFIND